jgi:aerobic C4-dicarboxylate transport protein
VLIGIALGVLVGALWPEVGVALKPLGDAFIKLVKLVIAPVIFCTVASGIARMGDIKAFGRVGIKALLYFEVVSTLALVIGLIVGTPAAGPRLQHRSRRPGSQDRRRLPGKGPSRRRPGLLSAAPDPRHLLRGFAEGNLLQVLVIAILTGFACTRWASSATRMAGGLEDLAKLFFGIIHVVVKLAPLGAFGAMGFTIGKYGIEKLVQLGALVATFYVTAILFVLVVLGTIAWACGFSILKFLAYIREELLIVLGTSSSESALPQMIEKLERLGARKSVVGLVIPTGYSFNLDGTNIYMTLATLFLAQATNTHLSFGQDGRPAGRGHADLEGGQRRDGRGLHHPGRHPGRGARHPDRRPGRAGRGRPVHERVPGPDQLRRQRRGHPGRGPLGGRAGSRPIVAGIGPGPQRPAP